MWIAAIFGLAGAIVGGLLVAGPPIFLEHRKERTEIKRAKRLIGMELTWASLDFEALCRNRVTPPKTPREGRLLATSQWDQYQAVLAGGLSDSEWGLLAPVYEAILGMRHMILDREPGEAMPPDLLTDAQDMIGLIAETRTRMGMSASAD